MSRPLTFAELAEGERFLFLWEQGESRICTKTGPRDYVAGEYAGHVGVGDNPVRRVPTDHAPNYDPAEPAICVTCETEREATINPDTGRPWQEDDAHGAQCAQRFAPAAECTCGKGDALAELDLHQPARVVATVDGRWMILVNGFQWGGTYDRSGAGDATFDSSDAAILAWTDAGHARASIAVERRR